MNHDLRNLVGVGNSRVRQSILRDVREAMQTAEELEGHMPTADYVSLMQEIAEDATTRAKNAQRAACVMTDAQRDHLNGLLDAYADAVREEHDTRSSATNYDAINHAMNEARDNISEWIAAGMQTTENAP